MSATTCATLATIFPVVFLVAVVEARVVNTRIRKKKFFINTVTFGASATIVGLVFSVIGIQTGGLVSGWGVAAWVAAAFAVGVLLAVTAMILATDETALSASGS